MKKIEVGILSLCRHNLNRLFWLTLSLACLTVSADDQERACIEAGGKQDKYICLCPDGETVVPLYQRCLNKPWTPDEHREACLQVQKINALGGDEILAAEDLIRFAKESQAKTATELFRKMGAQEPWRELVSHYVLMGNSESAERKAVTPDYPRRLKFTKGMIVASTGHPGHTATNNFVQVFIADREKGWQTLALKFDGKTVVPEKNPSSCTNCHGNPPRPNWASYSVWPGAYGRRGNYFFGGATVYPEDPAQIRKLTADYELLKARDDTKGAIAGPQAFGSFLNHWNFRFMANQFTRAPNYERVKYAMMGAILGCKNIPSFLGDVQGAFRKEHERKLGKSYSEMLGEVKAVTQRRMVEKKKLAAASGATNSGEPFEFHHEADNERVTDLRYLFEGNGVNVKHFSLDYSPGSHTVGYEFHSTGTESGGLRNLACHFMADIIESDPENLKEVGALPASGYSTGSGYSKITEKVCLQLKTKSLEVTGGTTVGSKVHAPTVVPSDISKKAHTKP